MFAFCYTKIDMICNQGSVVRVRVGHHFS